MQGVHGPTIAEHAFGMLLTLTRNLQEYTHPDKKGSWQRSRRRSTALNGKTLFVVGLGGIGNEVAKIGKGFGMRVLATRRSEKPKPDYVDEQGLPAALGRFLKVADVVVLSVPLTDETRGMIGKEQLDSMKDGAYLINVARGQVVDHDALVVALESGHLAGACLDVTDPEPLPKGHPLWSFENVIITPHVSGRSELTTKAWKETYLENIRRFGAGEPLLNVVDKAAGY
jgi:phosphoglycerate dehydrogenase-like enzyme